MSVSLKTISSAPKLFCKNYFGHSSQTGAGKNYICISQGVQFNTRLTYFTALHSIFLANFRVLQSLVGMANVCSAGRAGQFLLWSNKGRPVVALEKPELLYTSLLQFGSQCRKAVTQPLCFLYNPSRDRTAAGTARPHSFVVSLSPELSCWGGLVFWGFLSNMVPRHRVPIGFIHHCLLG